MRVDELKTDSLLELIKVNLEKISCGSFPDYNGSKGVITETIYLLQILHKRAHK